MIKRLIFVFKMAFTISFILPLCLLSWLVIIIIINPLIWIATGKKAIELEDYFEYISRFIPEEPN